MSTIKCPNCGNSLPEDSAFCNKCGSRIEQHDYDVRREQKRDYEDWDDEPANTRRRRADDDREQGKNGFKTLITVVAIAIAAFLAIFAINKIFFSGSNEDNQPVSVVDPSDSAAADALQRALTDNNYVGDGARIVYAKRISGSEPGKNDVIIGITQLIGNNNSESFYKLYELTQNGDKWKIDPEHIQKVATTGQDITFDVNRLKSSNINFAPQAPVIGGRKYFFFAFLSQPTTNDGNAKVVLNLYDIESRNITPVTFEGKFEAVNGEQVIVCDPAPGNSETIKWMNEQARNFIGILSFRGSAGSTSLIDPATETTDPAAQTTDPAATTEQAKPEQAKPATAEGTDKDSPMFRKEDIVETKVAGNYKVFRLKDGSVVRYDRTTGKNTKIHQGGAEAIGFEDTERGILNIRKSDGSREQVNLNSGQHSSKPAAKPATPEKKPETPAAKSQP